MAVSEIRIKFTGMKGALDALDPKKMTKALRKHLRRATRLNGKLGERAIRKVIQSGEGMERNAALTHSIKGDNSPLVGDSTLFNNITSKAISDVQVFVGVLRTSQAFNVAAIIHEGATVAVSPAMRGLFFILWKASTGDFPSADLSGRAADLFSMFQDWKPLKQSTVVIVIPPRRFIHQAWSSPDLKKQAQANWAKAIQAGLNEQARKGKGK
jgi:hypothetical protein